MSCRTLYAPVPSQQARSRPLDGRAPTMNMRTASVIAVLLLSAACGTGGQPSDVQVAGDSPATTAAAPTDDTTTTTTATVAVASQPPAPKAVQGAVSPTSTTTGRAGEDPSLAADRAEGAATRAEKAANDAEAAAAAATSTTTTTAAPTTTTTTTTTIRYEWVEVARFSWDQPLAGRPLSRPVTLQGGELRVVGLTGGQGGGGIFGTPPQRVYLGAADVPSDACPATADNMATTVEKSPRTTPDCIWRGAWPAGPTELRLGWWSSANGWQAPWSDGPDVVVEEHRRCSECGSIFS